MVNLSRNGDGTATNNAMKMAEFSIENLAVLIKHSLTTHLVATRRIPSSRKKGSKVYKINRYCLTDRVDQNKTHVQTYVQIHT